MSTPEPNTPVRHTEAKRLIDLARHMLDRSEEEMVVNYLDHAVEALHMLTEGQPPSP